MISPILNLYVGKARLSANCQQRSYTIDAHEQRLWR